jgi:branched-chain amino acid transport system permease protein
MGLGLNLIFGVLKVVNLAHGALFMMGSFMAVSLYLAFRLNPAISLLVVIPIFALIGAAMYFAFVPRLSKSRDSEIASFVLFFGVAYIIQSIALQFYGTSQYVVPEASYGVGSVEILGFFIPFSYFVATAFAVAFLLLIYYYLYKTKIGLSTRALMDNKEAAEVSGVNLTKVSVLAFIISVATVSAAGVFSSQILFSTSQDIGNIITVTSFSIIVIGGLGKPLATVAGGAVYALSYELSSIYAPNWIDVVPFLILVVVIVLRPTGLFGGKSREV